jgi:membrane associated rhomboid family serine protease
MANWSKPGSAYKQKTEPSNQGLQFILKPLYLIIILWVVFWLDQRFALDLYEFGIYPRQVENWMGPLASPLIHGDLNHLINNSIPIALLGAGLYYFYPKQATKVMVLSWLLSGVIVWLWARESYHIGASGLVYALAGFIFLSGVLRSQTNLLALSLLVVFIYGGLFWGLLPVEEEVSYEAHISGAAVGFILAVYYRGVSPHKRLGEEQVIANDDLSEQIALYGPDYWQQSNDKSGPPIKIYYHYRSNVEEHNPKPSEDD